MPTRNPFRGLSFGALRDDVARERLLRCERTRQRGQNVAAVEVAFLGILHRIDDARRIAERATQHAGPMVDEISSRAADSEVMPLVVTKLATALAFAGMRQEPPVVSQIEQVAMFAATDAPAPPLLPPEERSVS